MKSIDTLETHFNIPAASPVLVTGATGFTGAVLTRKLVQRGFEVRAIARLSSNVDTFSGLPIEWFRGDIFDEDTVARAVKGVKYIFHMATAYRDVELPDSAYDEVDLRGTQLLAGYATQEPGFERFIHVSTIGVHGHIDDPPADENYRMEPDDIYQRKKAEAELWIRSFAQRTGLPLTVVRPAGIYGPGDARLLKLFKLATGAVFPLIGSSKRWFHMIHVEDLADFMIHVASQPRSAGEVYICGNPSAITLKELARIIASAYGRKIRFVTIPAAPVFAAAAVCEKVCKPLKIKPPIFKRRVGFFTKDRYFDTRKMMHHAGFMPRYSYEEGLKETLEWYIRQGYLRPRKGEAAKREHEKIEYAEKSLR